MAILVVIFIITSCATSSLELQGGFPEDVTTVDTPQETSPIPIPFQATSMIRILDTDDTEKILNQPLSGFVESNSDTEINMDKANTLLEPQIILETKTTATIKPEVLIKEELKPQEVAIVVVESKPADILLAPKPSNLTIAAVGSGLSETEARIDALSALSGILYSQVKSSIEIHEKESEIDGNIVSHSSSYIEDIVVSTSLPILGASYSSVPRTFYDTQRQVMMYQVDVAIKAITSLPLYEGEIKRLASLINDVEQSLPCHAVSLVLEDNLSLLLGYYTQVEKLSYVAHALGLHDIPVLKQSCYSIESQLRSLNRVIDSYEKAAKTLTKAITKDGVYVYPAKLNGSGGVSEFAEQLSYSMRTSLGSKSVVDPLRASYFLLGEYTLKDDGKSGIYVTYRLEDVYGNVISTSLVELLPSVYEGQRFIPIAYDFQKQLERGDSIDTGFTADIRINGQKDYLTFHSGDNLTIEVKTSAPCYFYVVGYVFNDLGEKFSYLFPLKFDAVGKDMFVYRVSPEDVNKWIIINPTYAGKVLPIEVIEPFGVEMLQVYASTEKEYQKFLDTVPGFRETKDYYMVSENPEEGLMITRALNIKKVAKEAIDIIQRSESSVSFKSGR
jgi:hypothetical protein